MRFGRAAQVLVCYAVIFSVVTQRTTPQSEGRALRDDTKNGFIADYSAVGFPRQPAP